MSNESARRWLMRRAFAGLADEADEADAILDEVVCDTHQKTAQVGAVFEW
ncbi:hypothetical protein [Rhizobium lentis]|uniref:Uncharacterized protein n=1 Tax=Rhizobium lentis TaxID=1138194 RepID=A0ABS7IFZ6_9HYPH|nr:hypothetical protein [Rhizobium lentis]MBX4958815.1 hypothetical protein [Rhizobium lentis]MBX4976996.1 hypothetical protein [Rhizobium lentis]MBX4988821.1 hypothetical protein [Rhizobium lentis]MBX5007270.1 hypothetical protein [Rhizobium lentis]MBX5031867.1 hypothetical protein [Rhizobium lentis]